MINQSAEVGRIAEDLLGAHPCRVGDGDTHEVKFAPVEPRSRYISPLIEDVVFHIIVKRGKGGSKMPWKRGR